MFLLTKLTELLPARLQPYAKAVYPAIITIVGVLVAAVQTGVLDTKTITVAAGGAAYTLITFGVPNEG
jgi:hypothetical protein